MPVNGSVLSLAGQGQYGVAGCDSVYGRVGTREGVPRVARVGPTSSSIWRVVGVLSLLLTCL